MRSWVDRAGREWPLWIALVGILSLLFIPRVIRFGSVTVDVDRRELDGLKRDVDAGDPALAETRLTDFLARHPSGPLADEARILRARATVARGQSGRFPGVEALNRAWADLSKAPRTPDTFRLRRDVAALLSEFGLPREAVARFRELYDESRDADLTLDFVPALAALAALEPELRHALLDEASARVSGYLRGAPQDRRVPGLLALARIYREAERNEDLLTVLGAELADARTPHDRGLLHLERGRAFTRLGRHREMEAMSSFDEAEKLLVDPLSRGLALVHQAELFARASNPECLDVRNRLVAAESPAAPLALLVAGVYELPTQPAAALDSLRNGLAQIRRPRMIDDASFGFPWLYAALRAAADRETSPDRLLRFAAVWDEIGRLYPSSTRVGLDHAAVLLRARRFDEAADRFLAAGAVREAAEACDAGGLHLRAASLYRTAFDQRPASGLDSLFRRAASLKKAGDASGAIAGFEDYLAKAGPSGTAAGLALLSKAALQNPEEALATYDRILKARDVKTSPERDDWAQALLGRGRALLRLAKTADARKTLSEYLERYAGSPAPAAASIEAAWLLISVAIEERDWKAGLARVRDLEGLASRIPEPDRASYADLLREARFVEGDLHFNLENYAAAAEAYGEAVRRHAGSEERLWGLIGRARSLARLERKEEARRDYSNARAIFEEKKTLTGHGRDYWEIALDALAKEMR